MKTEKIDSQTYRINDRFVAFKREDGDWTLGEPVDMNDPMGGGFKQVSYWPTLADAKRHVGFIIRRERRQR